MVASEDARTERTCRGTTLEGARGDEKVGGRARASTATATAVVSEVGKGTESKAACVARVVALATTRDTNDQGALRTWVRLGGGGARRSGTVAAVSLLCPERLAAGVAAVVLLVVRGQAMGGARGRLEGVGAVGRDGAGQVERRNQGRGSLVELTVCTEEQHEDGPNEERQENGVDADPGAGVAVAEKNSSSLRDP